MKRIPYGYEKDFPSLKGKLGVMKVRDSKRYLLKPKAFRAGDVFESCLDKERVREAIERLESNIEFWKLSDKHRTTVQHWIEMFRKEMKL